MYFYFFVGELLSELLYLKFLVFELFMDVFDMLFIYYIIGIKLDSFWVGGYFNMGK